MSNRNQTNHNATTSSEMVVLYRSLVPFYATIIIASVGCVLLVCCCFWMFLRLCHRRKLNRPNKKGFVRIKAKSDVPSLTLKHESIQPDIEKLDDSDTDIKGNGNTRRSSNNVGKLHFALEYSSKNTTLTVTVIEARDLPGMDYDGTSDPYVKVRLLPHRKPVYCTKVVKSNCNPLFNETFTFEVAVTQIASRTLQFDVFDYDFLRTDDHIGTVTVPLSNRDLSNVVSEWGDVVKGGVDSTEKIVNLSAEICISLRYVAASGLLTVVVIEAKNLPKSDDGEDIDSFVKLTLHLAGKRIKRKATAVKKSCSNPYFNETFTFEVHYQHIATVVFEVAVHTPHFLKSKRIGFIECGLGVQSAHQSLHWSDMIANQRHSIARWHTLWNLEHHTQPTK